MEKDSGSQPRPQKSAPPAFPSGTFEEVALCHLDLVHRVALRLCGNPHEAEDLVQETFLRAHRAFGVFELRQYGAKPWLLKILHNAFLSRGSREPRNVSLRDDLTLDDFQAELEAHPTPDVSAGMADWEYFDEELKQAIEALSPEYRAVVLYWGLADLGYQEIAEIMGCALGTVMSRLHRARQQLGKALTDYAAERGIKRRYKR